MEYKINLIEVLQIIEGEGIDYALHRFVSPNDLEDKTLGKLVKEFTTKRKEIIKYLVRKIREIKASDFTEDTPNPFDTIEAFKEDYISLLDIS